MAQIFHEKDATLDAVKGKTIAVIGYGAQGRAQALMMHDSGLNVVVGIRPGKSADKAKADGLKILPVAEAAQKADIVHILLPDEVQGQVYEKEIKPHLKAGKALSFSHGFNIVFKKIVPPEGVDVIMVAPKAPGTEERKRYLEGFGVPALIAVKKNASGKAKDIALGMAKAMRFTKAGVFECTFEQETYSDLFGEQAVLCGGTAELIKAGFETLTSRGYPPEIAYFECLHELKLIVDLVNEGGLEHMWDVVSNTAEYGGRTRGKAIITPETKKAMQKLLDDIESGKFAEEWINEYKAGGENFSQLRKLDSEHQIEKTGKAIRAMFEK
ncbi:MAG: ketol-acid reductoisomerase [Candidatus Diapherotrites archaeon]|nr:ketol-acid reductoisomerase [Candidatus Diapherotrites archaeon]